MKAKALRNPALRTKFKVGDTFKIPTDVWNRLTTTVKHVSPNATVAAVGDKIIEHGKNRLCRFAVTVSEQRLGTIDLWEEWMLEKLVLTYATQEVSRPTNCTANGQPASS